MTSPPAPVVSSAVLDAIDAGHVGAHLTNAGEPSMTSVCKKDGEPWACSTIVEARAEDVRRRKANR